MTAARVPAPTASAGEVQPRRRRRFSAPAPLRLYGLCIGAAASCTAYAHIAGWRDRHAVLINTTQSLPNWAFLLETRLPPRRGDLVFFDPPPSPLLTAHFGTHPSAFGKRVYGMGGDRVTRIGRVFLINGRPVATAKPTSRRGEVLAPGPTGVIPDGCYFVATPHRDGFDSRYAAIGWICRDRVIGTGTAIL